MVAGIVVAGGLAAAGVLHFYALMSFGLCVFVAWTIVAEFLKGSVAVHARTGKNYLMSMVELTHRNTRRYGGYVVHMGIVLMFIGFSGSAFNVKDVVEVGQGESFNIGRYHLEVTSLTQGTNPNYEWRRAAVNVMRNGQQIETLYPEQRVYLASGQTASEVGIRRRLNEDIYLNYAGASQEPGKIVIEAYVFPLVSWIWLGFWVLFIGTLICRVPSKVKMQYARTQVVGMVDKRAKVQT